MSSEAAKSVKFLIHPPCTDITYIQLLTLTDNKTALMYKNKSKNEVFVQSSSWFWLLQQFSTQLQKTHKNLYSISSGSLFGFSNTCYKRNLRLRSILQVSSCQRVLFFMLFGHMWIASSFTIQSRYTGHYLPTLAEMSLQVRKERDLTLSLSLFFFYWYKRWKLKKKFFFKKRRF